MSLQISSIELPKYSFLMGLSAGDEGKGCAFTGVSNILINSFYDLMLIRCNGGCQAGNSVMIKGFDNTIIKKAFHAFPVITNLMDLTRIKAIIIFGTEYVFDPNVILDEVEFLRTIGYNGRIIIGSNVTIGLEENKISDIENLTIGSTGRGIGPAKINRLKRNTKICSSLAQAVNAVKSGNKLETKLPKKDYENYLKVIVQFDIFKVEILEQTDINNYMRNSSSNTKILVMGAHGAGISLESVRQPYVTTSDIFPYSAFTRFCMINESVHINGILKLPYMTRVGEGICTPYKPDSQERALFSLFLLMGREFGSTTGRIRKVCWNNLAETKMYVNKYLPTSISLTKLDLYLVVRNEILSDLASIKADGKMNEQYILAQKIYNFTDQDMKVLKEQLLNKTLTCKFIEGYNVNGEFCDFPYKCYTEADGFVDDYGKGNYNLELKYKSIIKTFPFPSNMEDIHELVLYVQNFLGVSVNLVSVGPSYSDVKIFNPANKNCIS